MNISILTVFPELFTPFVTTSLLKKSTEKGLVNFDVTSYFDFVGPKERIDAPTFGHGAGMLLKPLVVEKAINHREEKWGKAFRIFFSPHGKAMDQTMLKDVAQRVQNENHLMLVTGRYEGMDDRVEQEYADLIVSVGDFVVMGGDIPAMLFLEGLLRYIPGVVGRAESVEHDSFSGPFVDNPEFTEPVTWQPKPITGASRRETYEVPEVIRSGNHAAIAAWQDEQAAHRTVIHHFNWFRKSAMTKEQQRLGADQIPPHYAVLMHTDVLIKDQGEQKEGTTSVTSFDIHDIARSARTYGIKNYFIVTKLIDQQRVVQRLLDFWQTGAGPDYNVERFEAVKIVQLLDSLAVCIEKIEAQEGKTPVLVATSARTIDHPNLISFFDQEKVWESGRPVLFVFGTGRGLTPQLLNKSDFLLTPVGGLSDFNHLSVRSAVAIVFDRWLGWNKR
jgi:tRNA (guanine37-N1)-methyltransferase